MQVRVSNSPKAKNPPKGRKKNPKEIHPQSTYISSPIVGRRRKGSRFIDDEADADDDSEEEDNGFIVDDDEESDDGFEPVRDAARSRSRTKAPLGPPITKDFGLEAANLPDMHEDILAEFMAQAKKLEANIRHDKSLRKPLFTEIQLRSMCIHWTTIPEEILRIKDVDEARVRPYLPKFASLVKQFNGRYEEMMGHKEDRDIDPNHNPIIEISSGGEDNESSDHDEDISDGEPSKFFPSVPPAVQEFNDALAGTQMFKAPKPRAQSFQPKNRPYRGGRGGRGGSSRRAAGDRSSGSRRSSGPTASTAGVKKQQASKRDGSGRPSGRGGGSVFQNYARPSGGGSRGGQGGSVMGHFGAMPT